MKLNYDIYYIILNYIDEDTIYNCYNICNIFNNIIDIRLNNDKYINWNRITSRFKYNLHFIKKFKTKIVWNLIDYNNIDIDIYFIYKFRNYITWSHVINNDIIDSPNKLYIYNPYFLILFKNKIYKYCAPNVYNILYDRIFKFNNINYISKIFKNRDKEIYLLKEISKWSRLINYWTFINEYTQIIDFNNLCYYNYTILFDDINFINKFKYELNWSYISIISKLIHNIEFINLYSNVLDWGKISRYSNLISDINFKNNYKHLLNQDIVNISYVINDINFITNNNNILDQYDWLYISVNSKLLNNLDFIYKYKYSLNLTYVTYNTTLINDIEFIDKYKYYLDWIYIYKYSKLINNDYFKKKYKNNSIHKYYSNFIYNY
ncbi:tryptophan repeat gene family protein [Alphaentomopoxvirus acuprea]|uniref:Tryptophan repeat gene family protein n=1 Tax=Alphaentomopoxvirus acuprea TaxID=62099 RepID=W6JIY9_9POXV|nr:tryptophan repeat gene family protein [Anomala cuprea entomopoxvirus]BAO49537.1 tryptophan repeat gene family protein [Anomala cuprea entomopoxvirus]